MKVQAALLDDDWLCCDVKSICHQNLPYVIPWANCATDNLHRNQISWNYFSKMNCFIYSIIKGKGEVSGKEIKGREERRKGNERKRGKQGKKGSKEGKEGRKESTERVRGGGKERKEGRRGKGGQERPLEGEST